MGWVGPTGLLSLRLGLDQIIRYGWLGFEPFDLHSQPGLSDPDPFFTLLGRLRPRPASTGPDPIFLYKIYVTTSLYIFNEKIICLWFGFYLVLGRHLGYHKDSQY
ncbi:hypothetical protein AMTRI_Chr07g78620 [Amborella trichopoda]